MTDAICLPLRRGYTGGMTERELERVLKALANRRRLAILRSLKRDKEAPVGDIAAAIRLSFAATSRHLGILIAADLVERDQRGLQVFYRPTSSPSVLVKCILSLL
jgi:DNA-binding transcriptional ArsR family regulator